MRTLIFILAAVSLLSLSHPSKAGFNDPWYLLYKVSGGSLIKAMGPFSTKFECLSARYQLPIGAKFVGCEQ